MAEYGESLSEREIEILQEVSTGATNREVAYALDISPNTVKVHLRNIFTKLGVESRTEATMVALQEGWVSVPNITPVGEEVAAEDTPPEEEEIPPPPPLSWSRRGALIVSALLVVVATLLSWPRSEAAGSGSAPLPRFSGAGSNLVPSIAEASHWMERAQMPTRRAGLALAAWDDHLYAIGGEGPDGVTGAVEVYSPVDDTWEHAAEKPTPVAYVGATVLDGRVYVPGGCDRNGNATAGLEIYDPRQGEWSEGPALPSPVCAYALTVYDDQLYLFGGTDGEQVLETTFVYDRERDRWEERTAMPNARAVAAAARLGDGIYVLGGFRDGRELNTCAVYRPSEDRWESCAPMIVGRSGLGLVALGERLYAIGGGGYLGFNERYDPANDQWTTLDTPLTGVWQNPGVVLLDTTIYAVGGWSEDYIGFNLAFDPLPIRLFIPVTEG